MSKLSSKLYKNKNNTNILHYQIYLPKLLENILKYYRLKLFEEITTGINHGLQLGSLLQAFLTVSLFKLVNTTIILAYSSS